MAQLVGIYGIYSIGAGVVIITGGIDLSVGSFFALMGVVLAILLTEKHWSWPLAIIAVVGLGLAVGSLHGFLITRVGLQPFIVTLCGLLFYRGLARFIADDTTKGFGESVGFTQLKEFATGSLGDILERYMGSLCDIVRHYAKAHHISMLKEFPTGGLGGVPMPFILLVVISLLMWVALHRSVYGRYLFAVGRNEDAARYSGINTRRVTASAYVLCGALASVSGILLAFYTNSVSPSSHGNFYELYGIAAAVLGGCSLRGGEGSIIGILIGTALLQVLRNLVNLLGIPSSLDFAVTGAVILLGVIADQLMKQNAARRRKA
jgi:ribose transport system permease protein